MEKLRCGTILMDRFIAFLKEEDALQRSQGTSDPVVILEYVKCVEGDRAGEAFWSLVWGRGVAGRKDWCLFSVAGVTIYMSRQTQQALRWKHIDYIDNQVIVPS
ncbi:MAG: hypothetical protein KDN22_02405 [Verrucomicrobiae bacterium]|nr:hypothetical protein [Verrucomicrobiae bacterium]